MSEVEEYRNEVLYHENMIQIDIEQAASEVKLFKELGGILLPDGNMYGAVVGCLSTGCAGFGETRSKAVRACIYNYFNETLK